MLEAIGAAGGILRTLSTPRRMEPGEPDEAARVEVEIEVEGVDEKVAREALALAAAKLPVTTRFVRRGEVEGHGVEGHRSQADRHGSAA